MTADFARNVFPVLDFCLPAQRLFVGRRRGTPHFDTHTPDAALNEKFRRSKPKSPMKPETSCYYENFTEVRGFPRIKPPDPEKGIRSNQRSVCSIFLYEEDFPAVRGAYKITDRCFLVSTTRLSGQ